MPTDTSNQYSPSGAYDLGTQTNRVGNIYGTAQAVTQATSLATAVTINGTAGVITTQPLSLATLTSGTFAVNNTAVTANSVVDVAIQNFAGAYVTNGIPVAYANAVAAGTFNIIVVNTGANTTGANAIKIGFQVVG